MTERAREASGEYDGGSSFLLTLRAALQEAAYAERTPTAEVRARALLENAARPLLDRFVQPLLIWCQELTLSVADVPGRARLEGADLAQEAWVRVLRYLAGPNGDKVRDDSHLARLLRCTARNYLFDMLGSAPVMVESGAIALDAPEVSGNGIEARGERRGDKIPSPSAQPDILRFVSSGTHGDLIDALFSDEASFRKVAQAAGVRRHPRQFRAYVLYVLGAFLWHEIEGAPATAAGEIATLLREFAAASGVPVNWWEEIESEVKTHVAVGKVGDESATTALLPVINQLCEASVRTGNNLSVLRHDLNLCAIAWKKTGDGRTS